MTCRRPFRASLARVHANDGVGNERAKQVDETQRLLIYVVGINKEQVWLVIEQAMEVDVARNAEQVQSEFDKNVSQRRHEQCLRLYEIDGLSPYRGWSFLAQGCRLNHGTLCCYHRFFGRLELRTSAQLVSFVILLSWHYAVKYVAQNVANADLLHAPERLPCCPQVRLVRG